MPIIISLNEDGTIHGELETSVGQLSAIIRKAVASAPAGNDNPNITLEFGLKQMTIKPNKQDKSKIKKP